MFPLRPEKFDLKHHLRKTFIAGIFAAVPIAVTIYIIWWIDDKAGPITQKIFHRQIPLAGVVLAIVAIYLSGLLVNSLLGKIFLHWLDGLLVRTPVIKGLYSAWKQVALTPGGGEGQYSKVALVPDESGKMKMIGFTSGRVIPQPVPSYCVFVPSCPNPLSGRLYFVELEKCQLIEMSAEEAFKIILSTGNYVPEINLAAPPAQPAAQKINSLAAGA